MTLSTLSSNLHCHLRSNQLFYAFGSLFDIINYKKTKLNTA